MGIEQLLSPLYCLLCLFSLALHPSFFREIERGSAPWLSDPSSAPVLLKGGRNPPQAESAQKVMSRTLHH